MNYAEIKAVDIANGPGVRVSLFVSGCTHHCKGCFNEIAWDFNYGNKFTDETVDHIIDLLKPSHIRGITLLGGEPFDPHNQTTIVKMIRKIKEVYGNTKTIWAFTGYVVDKNLPIIYDGNCNITKEYIESLEVLVDGPFVEDLKDLSLRFRGSSNQRIIDIKKSLNSNSIVLWNDWQNTAGIKCNKNNHK